MWTQEKSKVYSDYIPLQPYASQLYQAKFQTLPSLSIALSELTISVLQACCTVTTEYGIPGDFVKTSTASLQIKISTAQVNFSNRKVIIF